MVPTFFMSSQPQCQTQALADAIPRLPSTGLVFSFQSEEPTPPVLSLTRNPASFKVEELCASLSFEMDDFTSYIHIFDPLEFCVCYDRHPISFFYI